MSWGVMCNRQQSFQLFLRYAFIFSHVFFFRLSIQLGIIVMVKEYISVSVCLYLSVSVCLFVYLSVSKSSWLLTYEYIYQIIYWHHECFLGHADHNYTVGKKSSTEPRWGCFDASLNSSLWASNYWGWHSLLSHTWWLSAALASPRCLLYIFQTSVINCCFLLPKHC